MNNIAYKLDNKLLFKVMRRVKFQSSQGLNLISGDIARVLFLSHFAKKTNDNDIRQFSLKLVDEIQSQLQNRQLSFNYGNGLTGILCGLKAIELLDIGYEFLFDIEDIILQVEKEIDIKIRNGSYEFLYGAIGLIQLLSFFNENELIELAIKKMCNSKIQRGKSVYWTSYNRLTYETNYIDLGLSHGMASILNILGRYNGMRSKLNHSEELLMGLYTFYKEIENPEGFLSRFPCGISNKLTNSKSRLAWCYGDPGIGISFLNAGMQSKLKELEEYGVKILLRASSRRDSYENGVKDPFLCHGSSGLAIIFLNAYKKTGIQKFYEAANFWLYHSLSSFDDKNIDNFSIGLLGGLVGIGLVQLSFESKENLPWERLLLLN